MTWIAAREEQLLDGHLLSVGQRNALERVAYLILHLYERAEGVGYAGNDVLQAPFTQAHFADALGITTVHLSRTLRRLRDRELVRWRDDSLEILNRPELERSPPTSGSKARAGRSSDRRNRGAAAALCPSVACQWGD